MKRILILFLALISHAHAFTIIDPSAETTRWPGDEVVFYYDSSCDSYRSVLDVVVQDAVDLWNSVPTSYLKLAIQESFGDSKISCANIGGGILGVGSYLGNLVLDGPSVASEDETLVATVVAHEMGHVLGLGHASSTDALMYYAVGTKTGLRLSQDDMDGISYLYPRDELGSDGIFGCASVQDVNLSNGPRGGAGGMSAWFVLLLLFWWGVRRRVRILA